MGNCRSRDASVKCEKVDPDITNHVSTTFKEEKKDHFINYADGNDHVPYTSIDDSNESRDAHESFSDPNENIPTPKYEKISDLVKNCGAMQAFEHLFQETIPFPKNGIKLSYLLNEFIKKCGGRNALEGKTTTDVCNQFVMPLTKEYELSYCDMILEKAKQNNKLDGVVKTATVFISHAWKYKFLDVLDALQDHFKDEPEKIVWFDIVSNNQHKATELEYEWWATTFKDAIKQLGHTVMVMAPWNDPIPYKRAWCIFEAYCTNTTGAKFEIAMSSNEKHAFIEACKQDATDPINKMLSDVDAEKSEAYNPDDKDRIHAVIREEIGFAGINSMLFEQLRRWVLAVGLKKLELSKEDSEEKMAFMNMVGTLYRNQGKNELAEPLYEECLSKREEKLGHDHPDTLDSMNNLALLYCAQGKYDLAEPLYEECISKREEKLGRDHPKTLNSVNNLANLYVDQGRYDLAEPLYKECLSKREAKIGCHHPSTLDSMNNLASLYNVQGKFDLAEPLYKECLSKCEEKLGRDHPKALNSINNLASLYYDQGNYDLAEPLYQECLSKCEEKLGRDHPKTLRCMNNLALLYNTQGNNDLAEQVYKDRET